MCKYAIHYQDKNIVLNIIQKGGDIGTQWGEYEELFHPVFYLIVCPGKKRPLEFVLF